MFLFKLIKINKSINLDYLYIQKYKENPLAVSDHFTIFNFTLEASTHISVKC